VVMIVLVCLCVGNCVGGWCVDDCVGVLVCSYVGVLVCWYVGVLMLVCWCTCVGVLVIVLVCWCVGVLVCRCVVLVFFRSYALTGKCVDKQSRESVSVKTFMCCCKDVES
jgi:hypothetical protein